MKNQLCVLLACLVFSPLFVFTGCEKSPPHNYYSGIHSSAVAFAYTGSILDSFFREPEKAYISGYFMFEDDLADDIVFGLDLEWMEGVDEPANFPGADWMALAGFNRDGVLWFPIGMPENLTGTATATDTWKIISMDKHLEPNMWYQMCIVADFSTRKFESVKITGEDLEHEFDLSEFQLEYPNYVPFDKHCITYYNFAFRNLNWAPTNHGGTKVYFDDIEFGLIRKGNRQAVYSNGFETQTQVYKFPVKLPVSPLKEIKENYWYFENDEAKVKITNSKNRSGQFSMQCDASLQIEN